MHVTLWRLMRMRALFGFATLHVPIKSVWYWTDLYFIILVLVIDEIILRKYLCVFILLLSVRGRGLCYTWTSVPGIRLAASRSVAMMKATFSRISRFYLSAPRMLSRWWRLFKVGYPIVHCPYTAVSMIPLLFTRIVNQQKQRTSFFACTRFKSTILGMACTTHACDNFESCGRIQNLWMCKKLSTVFLV